MENVRLSKHIIPTEYEIELKPDLENFTFEGVETIHLSILKKTKVLTLHSRELEIETAMISVPTKVGTPTRVGAKISYDEKKETASFTFPKFIPAGNNKLTLVFKGILNDKMCGFYRSCYHINGKEHHMATTQFEPTSARRAFPCFDEPAQKAVFHVSLIIEKGRTAISNTLPVSVKEHEGGYDIVKFHPTPKMSTYLLAFIVGNFEYIEKYTPSPSALPLRRGRGTRIRIYTTPGKKHQAQFALDTTVKTLEFYEKYFDIKYPLNTLDMIAIPDFTSGAMENWGAITYRESAILVDENHSSISNKQWVALVIAHELAHQWFGNLVTMEWWTHLWLNEGFATYIEYLAVDKLFPKWDIWTQFSTNELGAALRLDALANTHPIEIPVHHPDEIGEIFDEVSYAKGACIIRMLAGFLGEKDFRDGLRHYLKKHSYKNTETLHLWQAFEKVSKKPVAKMMRNWTSKPGYPVVKLKVESGKLKVSQKRFFANPLSAKKANDRTKWEFPLNFKNNKANFGETGFFRTAYSKELLQKLYEPIQNKKLSARDRLGIIRDLFALAEAGTIPTTDVLEFLSAYRNENNYTVWLEIALGLGRLEQLLAKTKSAEKLNSLIIELFSPLAKKLGWGAKTGEAHADTLLRSLAIARAGRAGDKKIIAEARKRFAKGIIHPDIRGAVYSVVATHGTMKEYRAFVARYKKETLHEEKNRLGNTLGDFTSNKILCEVIHFALSSNVRVQDTIGIISGVGANPKGRDIWLKCLKVNWETFVSRYGDGGHTLSRLVKAISGSAEEKHLQAFREFFAVRVAPGAKRSIEQVKERLEGNIAWLKRDRKKMDKFLRNSM